MEKYTKFIDEIIDRISDQVAEKVANIIINRRLDVPSSVPHPKPMDQTAVMYGIVPTIYDFNTGWTSQTISTTDSEQLKEQ